VVYTITWLIVDHRSVYLQKKKLSDLGSQWSKDELKRFYGAYRKYGKDWKKVCLISLPSYCGVRLLLLNSWKFVL
jgi:hypothetical protein